MFTKKLMLSATILVVITGCQAGPSAQDQAATMVAQTAAAAPATDTPAPIPTETPLPPTITPTSTLTPTPSGPLTFKDDFSAENKDAWQCTKCKWENDGLVSGPYDPASNLSKNLNFSVCKACGAHTYYHFKVEAIFMEGQVDRFFGVIAGLVEDTSALYLGISPYQFYTIRDYNFTKSQLKELAYKNSGVVSAGRATNVFEVDAKPGANGTVDFHFTLNGKRLYVLNGKPAVPTMVGLGMSFYAVTVKYDNFEYQEVVP